jgi:hypothetical protein
VDEGRGEVVGCYLRVQVDEWVRASHVGEQEQEQRKVTLTMR